MFWRYNINKSTWGTHWGRRNHGGPGDSACICGLHKACNKLKYSGSYLYGQVLTKLSSKSIVMYLGPIPLAKSPFTLLHTQLRRWERDADLGCLFSFLKGACDSLFHTSPENERLFVTPSWTSYLKKEACLHVSPLLILHQHLSYQLCWEFGITVILEQHTNATSFPLRHQEAFLSQGKSRHLGFTWKARRYFPYL